MPSNLRLSPSVLLLLAAVLPGADPVPPPALVPETAAAAADAAPWVPDPAVQAEVARLLAAAVAHGYPDTAGAEAFAGEAVLSGSGVVAMDGTLVTSTDPRTGRVVKRGASMERDGLHLFGYHLKLADGRWLAGLSYPVPAAAVDASRLVPLTLADFARELRGPDEGKELPPRVVAERRAWAERFVPEARPAVHAGMRWYALRGNLILSDGQTLPLLALHLVRLGVPDSLAGLALAATPRGDERASAPPEPPPLVLTRTDAERVNRLGRTAGRQPPKRQQEADATPLVLEPLPALTVRTLGAWFLAQFTAPAPLVTTAQAQAALATLYGADMPPAVRAELRLLLARAELPVLPSLPGEQIPFALRVAWWTPPDEGLGGHIAPVPRSAVSDAQLIGMRATAMTPDDIGALIALCGDTSASRWLDNGDLRPVVRTVGENALRILAKLLTVDPRVLVGRDPGEPWTPAAQAATATALQTWWRAHADQPLVTALAQTLPTIADVGAAGRLIAGWPAAGRAPLVAALVAGWRAHPPLAASAAMLVEALVALDGEPSVAEAVRTLPVAGAQRLVLVAWHACHGEQRPLDQLLAEVLAPDVTPPAAATAAPNTDVAAVPAADATLAPGEVDVVLNLATRYPSELRIVSLQAAMSGPLTSGATRRALGVAFMLLAPMGPVDLLIHAQSCAVPSDDPVLPRVLQLAALGDTRPVPPGILAAEQDHALLQVGATCLYLNIGRTGAAVALPADLRLCDVMAIVGTRSRQLWGPSGRPGQVPEFDITQPLAVREAVLVDLRQLAREAAEQALMRAKLPRMLLPAVGLPAAAAPSF